jgi:hypothetical protein
MFSYLSKADEPAPRLPRVVGEGFLKKYEAALCTDGRVVQEEYVEVPDSHLAKISELAPYFATSFAYVSSLESRPTTRKKAQQ